MKEANYIITIFTLFALLSFFNLLFIRRCRLTTTDTRCNAIFTMALVSFALPHCIFEQKFIVHNNNQCGHIMKGCTMDEWMNWWLKTFNVSPLSVHCVRTLYLLHTLAYHQLANNIFCRCIHWAASTEFESVTHRRDRKWNEKKEMKLQVIVVFMFTRTRCNMCIRLVRFNCNDGVNIITCHYN